MSNLTPEQKRDVLYSGGLQEKVVLAGREVALGELPLREFPKLFQAMEADLHEAAEIYRKYIGRPKGFIRRSVDKVRSLFGLVESTQTAIGLMRNLVEGLTKSDVAVVQMCARGRNDLTDAEVEALVLAAPRSEVQKAIHVALELNGIDTKKFMAARGSVPSVAARGI